MVLPPPSNLPGEDLPGEDLPGEDLIAPRPRTPGDDRWTAGLIIIGDEILSGRTQDANLAEVARWLNLKGVRLAEARVVGDDEEAIGRALEAMLGAHDYVFTTGGIGPTHDDITVDAVARALGRRVVIHPEAEARLRAHYGDRLTPERLRMARVPEGAALIDNPETKAPGIRLGRLFLLAGVPFIARGMLSGLDQAIIGGRPVLSLTLGAWTQESRVAGLLREVQDGEPGVQIGSYPFWREGRGGANFVIRATDELLLRRVGGRLAAALAAEGIEPVEGGL